MKVLKNSKGEWDWLKITIPILTIIIIPLVALIYNNMANAVESKADKALTEKSIEVLKEDIDRKANNETIILMLKQQAEQIQSQKVVDKEMLETLQNLNIQIERMKK